MNWTSIMPDLSGLTKVIVPHSHTTSVHTPVIQDSYQYNIRGEYTAPHTFVCEEVEELRIRPPLFQGAVLQYI